MRLPRDKRQRVAIVITALAVATIVVASYNLFFTGSDDDLALGPLDGSGATSGDLQPGIKATPDPTLEDEEGDTDGKQKAQGGLLAGSDPFSTSRGPAAVHTITMNITTTGPVRLGYGWRDKNGPGEKVTGSTFSITRTFKTSLPGGQIALQLSGAGGKATCSVVVDGVKYSTYTADGPYRLAICSG